MYISDMVVRGASAVALVFTVLMTNVAVACDTCLLHAAAPAVPTGSEPLVQPSFLPVVLTIGIGLVLVCAGAYGAKRVLARRSK